MLTFCPRGGVTSCYCLLYVHAIARRFLYVRCGTARAYREFRFGCREIKVPSAPIFVNTVYSCCFITVTKAFFNIIINHYRVCE